MHTLTESLVTLHVLSKIIARKKCEIITAQHGQLRQSALREKKDLLSIKQRSQQSTLMEWDITALSTCHFSKYHMMCNDCELSFVYPKLGIVNLKVGVSICLWVHPNH